MREQTTPVKWAGYVARSVAVVAIVTCFSSSVGAGIVVAVGKRNSDLAVAIKNSCAAEHRFTITKPGLAFVTLDAPPNGLRIAPQATALVQGTADATAIDAGTYRDQLTVECADCVNEPGCKQDRYTVDLVVEVYRPRFLIRLLVFSGTPNPAFILTDPNVIRALDEAFASASPDPTSSYRTVVPSILGYHGIFIDEAFKDEYPFPLPLIVYRDRIEAYWRRPPAQRIFFRDTTQQIEQLLLNEAVRQGVFTEADLRRLNARKAPLP